MAKEEKTEEVKRLISMGKEKGFLTYRDLNATLPADMVSTERLTGLMAMFGEMDIEIIDSPEGERYQQMMSEGEGSSEEAEDMEEAEEVEDKKIDLTPGDLARTDDPVRLYLKEMGSVSLLSREGEIEIAKRIEEGKQDISTVVFGMPMTIKAVSALVDQVRARKVPAREVVSAGVDEEFEEVVEQDDDELRKKTLDAIRKLDQVKPFNIASPCRFELQFYISAQADMAMYMPNVPSIIEWRPKCGSSATRQYGAKPSNRPGAPNGSTPSLFCALKPSVR